jgi:general secretion pathway protein G
MRTKSIVMCLVGLLLLFVTSCTSPYDEGYTIGKNGAQKTKEASGGIVDADVAKDLGDAEGLAATVGDKNAGIPYPEGSADRKAWVQGYRAGTRDGFFGGNHSSGNRSKLAQPQVETIVQAVQAYHFVVGAYPPTLEALLQPPNDAAGSGKWNGPYVKNQQDLIDPWGKLIQYAAPGSHGQDFDVWTESPDGKVIGSWD